MKIIGITGRAGVGKDTVADIILEQRTGVRLAFAGALKRMTCACFDISMEELEDRKFKESPMKEMEGKSPRQWMQLLGTEFGRNCIGENLWVNIIRYKLEELGECVIFPDGQEPVVVITDVRFKNEAEMIRSSGGIIIHVKRATAEAVSMHSSENPVHEFTNDWVVNNNGSIADLKESIVGLIDDL